MNTFSTTIIVIFPINFGSHLCFVVKFKNLLSAISSSRKM